MGIAVSIKNLKLREWINIGFFLFSLAMLIAGSVMLAVAIASIPPMPPIDEMPTTTETPTVLPNIVFTSSFVVGVTWSSDLSDSSSAAYKSLSTELQKNISTAWVQNAFQNNNTTVSSPLSTQINAFTQGDNGVNFYSQFVFVDASVTPSLVSDVLLRMGYSTDSYSASTMQCVGLKPPSYKSTINPSSTPVSIATETPLPTQPGAFCDVSKTSLINIFLVDVSDPIIGTLDDKLKKVSSFLMNAPLMANLAQSNAWDNQEYRLVTYGSNEATPLGRAKNQNDWKSLLGNLNTSIVNPLKADGHEMTDALRFVFNNYRPTPGTAGNIVVIGDGFDFDQASTAQPIASALKNTYFYSLGFILMTTSQAMQNIVQSLASDFYHFYPIDSVDYLNNQAVQKTQALWTCEAFYPTPSPPTPVPTILPLITTTNLATNPSTKPTASPLVPPIASCQQNVLFLIDQSQTMILNGYNTAIECAIKTAESLASLNSQTTFAYIIYNQIVVAESSEYTDVDFFVSSIKNIPQSLGNSDINVGFTEALNFIQTKSRYDDDSTRSLLYFFTDGNDFGKTVPAVSNTTKTIRSEMLTQIIGIDLVETISSKKNVQQAIQFNVTDGYTQSIYMGVSEPSEILNETFLNNTNYQLECKDTSNCYTSLTFVIETSQAEGETYVNIQVKSIIKILEYYHSLISPFKLSVSLIYFSSPDNLLPNQSGQSGILFEQITESSTAINFLNSTKFDPLGAASDLQLGFSYTAQSLKSEYMQNRKLVIFFARGEYEKLSNCCPDPSTDAFNVRTLAEIQGVLIGTHSSKEQLNALTGSSAIDANAIINNATSNNWIDEDLASQNIASAILPSIDNFIKNQVCPDIPSYVSPPCEDPIDVLILLHADDKNNWNKLLNFTASQLIPDLLGTTALDSTKQLTTSTPINLAIVSYYYLDVITHADFTFLRSKGEYMQIVNSLPFLKTSGTATLSLAYKKAVDIFSEGRRFASKNLIVLTDTMDISDMEDAFSEHDAMTQQVGGNTSALTINTNVIPGADNQINIDSVMLSSNNKYSLRQIANSLTRSTCVYNPKQMSTIPPIYPSPTLPGPIPVVKARNVWPDIVILIDTSVSQNNPMNSMLFEKIRTFIDVFITQYSVGEKGSRFTLATFDGETIRYSCKFADVNNYYDLSSCRNEKFTFYSESHSDYRDITNALSNIRENIYENSTSGYRALNENFIILFTLGLSSTSMESQLPMIQRKGVQTIVIGLSNNLTNNDLSVMAQTAYKIPNWNSVYSGIDTNYNLADRLFQETTKKRSPTTANFFANLVFVVDVSSKTANDYSNIVKFVSNFVSQFLVGPTKTQISIVPFADEVIFPLVLSSSQQQVDQYLNQWKTSNAASSDLGNVGEAIQYVSNMLGASPDRQSYVIFTVGATNLTGSELSKQLLKQSQLYVANYNLASKDFFADLVFSTDDIFSVTESSSLLDRVVSMNSMLPNPVLALSTEIFDNQEGFDEVSFPISSIAADIIILLDETGLNDNQFLIVKNFLKDFIAKFSVGPLSTQFALQTYNGRTIPHDGFHLFESTSIDNVMKRIDQLTLAKATENSTDADLAGAIEQELFFFLTEENGWRNDVTTYTIIFSHAESFYERDTSTAETVKNVSSVFAVGFNGNLPDYVKNFTNTGFYEYVSNASLLTINSPVIKDLLQSIDNDYKKEVYPEPYDIHSIAKADFLFLIDNALGPSYTQMVQTFLNNFIINVGTFSSSGNNTRLAVVSYGTDVSPAWNFQASMNVDDIRSRIKKFSITTFTGISNLKSAIDSVILDEINFGINSNRPTYMIVISGSLTINPKIDISTSRHLNSRYSTFIIQTNIGNNTYSYAEQFLGTQLTQDRVARDALLEWGSNGMNNFSPWISNEFSAWLNTFPNK